MTPHGSTEVCDAGHEHRPKCEKAEHGKHRYLLSSATTRLVANGVGLDSLRGGLLCLRALFRRKGACGPGQLARFERKDEQRAGWFAFT